jgi:hypothetical protein
MKPKVLPGAKEKTKKNKKSSIESTPVVLRRPALAIPVFDRLWVVHALKLFALIVATYVGALVLAGFVPNVFQRAFEWPNTTFAPGTWAQSYLIWATFLLFALFRALLALRIVDHDVRVQSIGDWVAQSVLSDFVFQIGLTGLVALMPLPFHLIGERAWYVLFATIGGLITGFLQWYKFNPATRPAQLWIYASGLAWALTTLVLSAIVRV